MSDTAMPDMPDDVKQTIEQDIQEARESFTLVDMFAGTQRILPTKKRIIFRDLEAAGEYEEVHEVAQRIRDLLETPEPEGKQTAQEKRERKAAIEELQSQLSEIEPQEQAAKEKMLRSAVVFHLRAFPRVAQKIATREARKIFTDPSTGQYKDGVTQDEVTEWMKERLFGELVQRVTDSVGNEIDFGVPKAELGEVLSNGQGMHPVHWALLMQDYDELTVRAGIVQVSLQDAGF